MRTNANTNEEAGGRMKVTIKRQGKSGMLEKAVGLVMILIGFGAALVVGYLVLPNLLYEKVDQPFQFNHEVHMSDKASMNCEDCHRFREDGTFAGIPTVSSCADCHSEPLGESALEKELIENFIKPGKEIPWLVYSAQPDNAFFPHVAHVKTAKIPCTHCHGDHGKTNSLRQYERNKMTDYSRDVWGKSIVGLKTNSYDRMKMDDCANCHAEKGVKDSCMMCHK